LEGRCVERGRGGHGSWYFQLDLPRGSAGERRRLRRGGFGSRREAIEALNRIRVPAPDSAEAQLVAVSDWLGVWLATRCRGAEATVRNYRLHVRRYLGPLLRLTLLSGLDAKAVKAVFVRLLRDGVGGRPASLATAHAVYKTLRTALNAAVTEGYLERNPAQAVQLPAYRRPRAVVWTEELIARWRESGERPAVAVWTAPQVAAFLNASGEHPLYAAFHLIAFRGLRRGEVAGLRWMDLDLDAGLMHITYQVQHEGGKRRSIRVPKTPSSAAWMALDTVTVRVLREHRARQLEMLDAFRSVDTGFVFQMSDGTPLRPDRLYTVFQRLIRACGLPPIRLHDLRHTAASLALQAGVSLKVIQETLRHTSIVLTADTYVSVLPAAAREAAEAIAQLILAHGARVPGTTRTRRTSARPLHVLAA
jgi:integrase